MRKSIGAIVIVIGIIAGLVFFASGNQLNKSGDSMKLLVSQSGTSLAEAYYQDMGKMNTGLGTFAYALGLGIMAISIGIGAALIRSNETIDINKTTTNLETEDTEQSLSN